MFGRVIDQEGTLATNYLRGLEASGSTTRGARDRAKSFGMRGPTMIPAMLACLLITVNVGTTDS